MYSLPKAKLHALAALFCCPLPTPATAQSPSISLDADLEVIRGRNGVPGLSGMVVKGGQIIAQGAAGIRRQGYATPLQIDDPVNIGSCTKWMTATLAGRLVDRGVIEWTTRIRDVFPASAGYHPAYADTTLEEFLAHRAGAPDGNTWEQRFRNALAAQNGPVLQLRRWVAEVTLADRPAVARGTELYSNQGYTIAAAMLELRTGRSWETLMADEVFAPLGLTSARIGVSHPDNATPPAGIVGHDLAGGLPVPRTARTGMDLQRYQASTGPAGMVVCTLRDWARFLHVQAMDAEGYLRPETAAKLRAPFAGGSSGYALGVQAFTRAWAAPGPALNHNGDIFGATSSFWLAPGRDLIAIAFTNMAAQSGVALPAVDATTTLLLSRYQDAVPSGPYVDGAPPAAPTIARQPASQKVAPGQPVTFTVGAEGRGALAYQWFFNDEPIAGATGGEFSIARVDGKDAGYYSVEVRSSVGGTFSAAAALSVESPGRAGCLSNLSLRATLSTGRTLAVGFTVQGGVKPLLLRAVGPGLAALGVSDPMPNPSVTLFAGPQQVAANDDWSAGAAVAAAVAAVGAFPIAAGSADAVLLRTMGGSHTVHVHGSPLPPAAPAGSGTVIVEVYDAGAPSGPRLVNLSVLHEVGGAGGSLTAGFTVTGTEPRTVLLRAAGPALAALGVENVCANPQLELFAGSGARLAVNDDWDPSLAAAFVSAGAFPLPAGSRDAALVVRLPPGGYTAQVSGANGASGQTLVEVYELQTPD